MDELMKLLDENLICTDRKISGDFIHFYVQSTRRECMCPDCQTISSRIHSRYNRSFQDLPIQGKKVLITLSNRKMFCDNLSCDRTTFAESFSFIENKAKKTKRLKETILEISLTQSSVSAATYLTQHVADVKKSTICSYQKKANHL
jgi:transposase